MFGRSDIHPSFTDLTLGPIESTGTGADVGLHAGPSIQTDGVTESCRRQTEASQSWMLQLQCDACLVIGFRLYLSYMSVRTSQACICRHQETHILLHFHSACYTPLKPIHNSYALTPELFVRGVPTAAG